MSGWIAEERHEMKEPAVPRLVPAPSWCSGIQDAVICLDGEWEVEDLEKGDISKVQVPFDMGILHRQGLSDRYVYYRDIPLPERPGDSRVVLQFEGVNGFVEVYVEDTHVASHQNAFLTWNVDITRQAAGREQVRLKVVMDEASDQVSCFNHGGILHSVWLYVLPEAYVNAMYLSPLFTEDRDRCRLRVDLDVAGSQVSGGPGTSGASAGREADLVDPGEPGTLKKGEDLRDLWVNLRLYDPQGQLVAEERVILEQRTAPEPVFCPVGHREGTGERAGDETGEKTGKGAGECARQGYFTTSLSVEDPILWDAEHPLLYRLVTELYRGEEKLETLEKRTGLRQIERRGNRLYVNGREVKLRGTCRHEISPRSGRALTRELIRKDVELFKEANCNYIRTSHYPPSAYFLELCDEQGIYVEDEMALAFVAKTTLYSQRDPEQTGRFLSHFTELLARDYNHPSVIIWSLANESFGGYNFDLLNRYIHRKDPTRMTKFSYPMTIQEEHEMPDIWSIHYSEYDTDLGKKRDNVSVGHAPGRDMPVLHDEYIHVCCYNREELRRDPAIRTFWGESIRIFWDKIWHTDGALGGAIWAGIDETDIYDGGNTQLEWGIIDVWRRRKPEFYMTRKAYSPLKILHSELIMEEKMALLVVENRFCHTNLREVCMSWKWGGRSGRMYLPEAVPGKAVKVLLSLESGKLEEGKLEAGKPEDGKPEDGLWIEFLDANGWKVDELLVEERKGRKALRAGRKEDTGTCRADGSVSCGTTQGTKAGQKESPVSGIAIRETTGEVILEGTDTLEGTAFRFAFDRKTGLLKGLWVREGSAPVRAGEKKGGSELEAGEEAGATGQNVRELASEEAGWQRLLMGGPILNVPYLKLGEWYLTSFGVKETGTGVEVTIEGGYRDTLAVTFRIFLAAGGVFTTSYMLGSLKKPLPKALKLRVGVDGGGLDELGVAYLADPSMDTLDFERNFDPDREWGYAWYPEDHISRRKGIAHRFTRENVWGQEPVTEWGQDMRDDILYGRYDAMYQGSNDFRSTKEDVSRAGLHAAQGKGAILVLGKDGAGAVLGNLPHADAQIPVSPAHVRLEVLDPEEWKIKDTDSRIRYTGTWYAVEDKKESDHGTEMWSREKGARAECSFTGTGIVWYGPQDTTYGMANVYVDGDLAAGRLSQRVSGVDFPCSSAGYDKKYHLPIFSIDGLAHGEHTLAIEVCGEKAEDASDTYIVIDYLRVLTGVRTEPVRLNVNQDFAYPHISWGNYRKPPILIEEGTCGRVVMQAVWEERT